MNSEIILIGSDTAHITRWWVKQGLNLIQQQPDIFSDMREARVKFIAGANRIKKTIKNWLISANLIKQQGRSFFITDFGKRIIENDPELSKSSTWIAIHLNVCFSDRGEPYISLFNILDPSENDWMEWKDLCEKIYNKKLKEKYESSTVKYDLEGVRGMFESSGPFFDLDFMQIKKNSEGVFLRLGSPKITDQAIVYALALARHRHFPSSLTIEFSELDEIKFSNFFCLPITKFRYRLREISRSTTWHSYFSFNDRQNLQSIEFREKLNPNQTLLHLLQESEDTWI
jgi:hypothetical protein